MEINLTDDQDNKIENIGRVDFLIVNIDEASQGPYHLYDVIDAHSEYLARHAFEFFDPETGDYTEKLNEQYHYELMNRNFCLIQKITILPKYRGFNIGAKAIRDIVFHYSAACGLFVVQPYPLQFEFTFDENKYDHLDLKDLEQNETKAKKKLIDYYKSMGFKSVKGIKSLLFYNPALKNDKMDKIDLDDPEVFKLRVIK